MPCMCMWVFVDFQLFFGKFLGRRTVCIKIALFHGVSVDRAGTAGEVVSPMCGTTNTISCCGGMYVCGAVDGCNLWTQNGGKANCIRTIRTSPTPIILAVTSTPKYSVQPSGSVWFWISRWKDHSGLKQARPSVPSNKRTKSHHA